MINLREQQKPRPISEIEKTLSSLTKDQVDCTAEPYWLIIDPYGVREQDVDSVALAITGPFFSRRDAEERLESARYNYSDKTQIWALSGCYTKKYKKLCRDLKVGYAEPGLPEAEGE